MLQRRLIGLSSGSSIAGVDAALVRADGCGMEQTLRLEQFLHVPYSKELRDLLSRVSASPAPQVRHLATLHRVLGESFALVTKQLLEQGRCPAQEVFCIGCPGHTLYHDPDGRYPATMSLGMTGVIAERTGITTVGDFASRDLTVGGQASPLTALVDAILFQSTRERRLLVHLGTVATIVSMPSDRHASRRNVIGFEAAPCTLLLDGLMRLLTAGKESCDAGGKHAVQGRCLEPLLERWMQHPFFQRRPPKSVPRFEFGDDFLGHAIENAKGMQANLHDVLCTMTHFVARALVRAIRSYLPERPERILLSGGGVRNGFLWHLLEQQLAPAPLEKTDVYGIPAEARKAVAHAGLAALTSDGIPVNLPSVTGATGPRLLGNFTPGTNANWARCLGWMARQSAPMPAAAA